MLEIAQIESVFDTFYDFERLDEHREQNLGHLVDQLLSLTCGEFGAIAPLNDIKVLSLCPLVWLGGHDLLEHFEPFFEGFQAVADGVLVLRQNLLLEIVIDQVGSKLGHVFVELLCWKIQVVHVHLVVFKSEVRCMGSFHVIVDFLCVKLLFHVLF